MKLPNSPLRKLLVIAGLIQLVLAVGLLLYFVYIRTDASTEKTLGSVVNDAVPTSSPSPNDFIPPATPARVEFPNTTPTTRDVEFVLVAATQQQCATARIQGPPNNEYREGRNIRLAVVITGAPAGAKFGYEWTVNPGVIIGSNRTAQILVNTKNTPNGIESNLKITSHVCINQLPTPKLRPLPKESEEPTTPPKPAVKTFRGRLLSSDTGLPMSGVQVSLTCVQGGSVPGKVTTDGNGNFAFRTDMRGQCNVAYEFPKTGDYTDKYPKPDFQSIVLKEGTYDLGVFRIGAFTISTPPSPEEKTSPSVATPTPTAEPTAQPTSTAESQTPITPPNGKPTATSTSAATTGEFVVTWPRALGPNEEGTVSVNYTPPANDRLPRPAEGYDKVEALVKPTNLRGLTLINSSAPEFRRLDNNQLVWNYQVKAQNDEVSELSCDTEVQLRLTNTATGRVVELSSVQLGQANIDVLPVRPGTILGSGMILVPTGAGSLGLGISKRKRAKCFFKAAMRDQVVVAEPVRVEVMISREDIPSGQMLSDSLATSRAEGVAAVDTKEKLTLQLEPVSNYKVVGPSRIDIEVPKLRSPKTYEFMVEATHVGEGEIAITAYQHQTMLVTLELKSQIVASLNRAPAITEATAAATESEPLVEPINQLFITEERHGDRVSFKYQLNSPALDIVSEDWVQPMVRESSEYVDSIYARIEGFRKESHTYEDPEQRNDYFNRKLYSFGGELFDELFPEELKRVLWTRRDRIQSIWVISTEPFIPWELVCLKDPDVPGGATKGIFLAELGLIRWLKKTTFPPNTVRIRKGRALYVIPEYVDQHLRLPEAEDERVFLREKFQAEPTPADPLSILDVLGTPGNFDLLHFACHGRVTQNRISDGCLLLQDKLKDGVYGPPLTLAPTEVGQLSNLSAPDNRPLITVNACQAGRAGYLLSGMGGFAQSFIKSGAGAFVGTLWSVKDSPARTFTETLYHQLLSGAPLCRATVEARKQAKSGDTATWLAYVVYGHPHMRLNKSQR